MCRWQPVTGIRLPTGQAYYQGSMASKKYYGRNTIPKVLARYIALHEKDDSAMELAEEVFAG